MSTSQVTTLSVKVTATPFYLSEESSPSESFFVFGYRIRIENQSSETVQLLKRHWIISDAMNRVQEVHGSGVVGLQPKIQPGESFEYESFCPLNTPSGSMKGHYEMISAQGHSFTVPIEEFYLIAPQALH